MARILGTGIATLDVINEVDGFPNEDSETRALSQRVRRGGNATNTLVVLSQLGHDCAWAGTLGDDGDSRPILDELRAFRIDTTAVQIMAGGHTPTSYVTRNRRNGSRTIVHWRDLPEYAVTWFRDIRLGDYQWLHFEGRNLDELVAMLRHAEGHAHPPISIEIEKPRPGIERLYAHGDVLLFSRPYARHHGHDDGAGFLRALRARCPRQRLFCTWGADGAYALDGDTLHHLAAAVPAPVVDTLGAGDTFNAGVIHALASGLDTATALDFATRLAGLKCGIDGLTTLHRRLPLPDRSTATLVTTP